MSEKRFFEIQKSIYQDAYFLPKTFHDEPERLSKFTRISFERLDYENFLIYETLSEKYFVVYYCGKMYIMYSEIIDCETKTAPINHIFGAMKMRRWESTFSFILPFVNAGYFEIEDLKKINNFNPQSSSSSEVKNKNSLCICVFHKYKNGNILKNSNNNLDQSFVSKFIDEFSSFVEKTGYIPSFEFGDWLLCGNEFKLLSYSFANSVEDSIHRLERQPWFSVHERTETQENIKAIVDKHTKMELVI